MKQLILTAIAAATLIASQSMADSANVNLGFARGALALGGAYVHGNGDASWGGYLYHQTEKKKGGAVVVPSVTTLGAMLNINLVKKANVSAYIAPGFGLAMTDNSKGDSTTVFGPSMKIGAQYAINAKARIGIERFLITNWFSDDVVSSAEFTSAVLSFDF